MCTYLACLACLLVALILAEPVSCQEIAQPDAPGESLCPFVRAAADQRQLEAEASGRLREAERLSRPGLELPRIPFEAPSSGGSLALPGDRILFEQQAILERFLARCGVAADRRSLAASVFGQFHTSLRATFVGITQAMMNTSLTDKRDGQRLGDALGLIQELIDIQGENGALSSDNQFQLIVRLAPDALEKLDRAASFAKGENHIFHKGYPIFFRQFRRIGLHGQEAGLHFCSTRDGRFAQIHIDYRFWLLHLGPANSDVRADGNHQRHADRWPEFTLAEKPIRVRRVVLDRRGSDARRNSVAAEGEVPVDGDFRM